MLAERGGHAMGTRVHLVVDADAAPLLEGAGTLIADLERRWSRFLPDSELSALNRAGGRPVVVSAATRQLVGDAIGAWYDTGGRFDPTVLDPLCALGYDRTFADVAARSPRTTVVEVRPTPAARSGVFTEVDIDEHSNVVRLPAGVHLDLGGIGKGAAADAAAEWLVDHGARHACVSIGGDLRAAGSPPPDGWSVHLPTATGVSAMRLDTGGACTSTTTRRRWTLVGRPEPVHHLIDPGSGMPTDGGLATVTVFAASATAAEIWTKAAMVAGWPTAADELAAHGLDAVLISDDGQQREVGRAAATAPTRAS